MSKFGEHIDSILETIPDTPGIYQYFNKIGQIITRVVIHSKEYDLWLSINDKLPNSVIFVRLCALC